MPTAPLTSLAILQVNHDRGKDYIDLFVPVVAYAALKAGANHVASEDLQAVLSREFHLEIPLHTLNTIAKRAAREGYFSLEKGAYRVNAAEISALDLASKQAEAERAYAALVEAIISFARDRFGVVWAEPEADAALLRFLSEFDIDVLYAVQGAPAAFPVEMSPRNSQFIVSTFIQHANASDPLSFGFFETVAKGHILSNVIYYPDLNRIEGYFKKTRFVLDTEVVLKALGFEGRAVQNPAKELFSLIHKLGGSLVCFSHTVDEIQDILIACSNALLGGGVRRAFGPVVEHFISIGYSASDLRVLAEKIPSHLIAARIKTEPKPSPGRNSYFDEARLEQLLEEGVHYNREAALERDVSSVSGVAHIRGAARVRSIEDAKAVFVTTNDSVASIANDFFKVGSYAPYAVTDHSLTNYVWLKQPFQAPDLPRKRIIAACAAALEPEPRLWKAYIEKANELLDRGDISREDFLLLRSSIAQSGLVNLTLNQPEAFTDGTVADVLERVQIRLRHEHQERENVAIAKAESAEAFAKRWEEMYRSVELRSTLVGVRVGRVIKAVLVAGSLFVLAVGSFTTLPNSFPPVKSAFVGYILSVLQLGMLILGISNLMWGTTVNAYLHRIELWTGDLVARGVRRVLGVTAFEAESPTATGAEESRPVVPYDR